MAEIQLNEPSSKSCISLNSFRLSGVWALLYWLVFQTAAFAGYSVKEELSSIHEVRLSVSSADLGWAGVLQYRENSFRELYIQLGERLAQRCRVQIDPQASQSFHVAITQVTKVGDRYVVGVEGTLKEPGRLVRRWSAGCAEQPPIEVISWSRHTSTIVEPGEDVVEETLRLMWLVTGSFFSEVHMNRRESIENASREFQKVEKGDGCFNLFGFYEELMLARSLSGQAGGNEETIEDHP